MKKIIFLFIILAVFCSGLSLFAQDNNGNKADFYYYNFPIEKIYSHRLGYVVIYRRSENLMGRTFLPVEWFSDTTGKGELIGLRSGSEWPSMSVYYRDGKFSHVRVKARWNKLHSSWGMVPLNVNMDEFFKDTEEVKLEF